MRGRERTRVCGRSLFRDDWRETFPVFSSLLADRRKALYYCCCWRWQRPDKDCSTRQYGLCVVHPGLESLSSTATLPVVLCFSPRPNNNARINLHFTNEAHSSVRSVIISNVTNQLHYEISLRNHAPRVPKRITITIILQYFLYNLNFVLTLSNINICSL